VVLLEVIKTCPKGMETVVWDGWTRSDVLANTLASSLQQISEEIAKMPFPHLASV
jgi:hypothetical protein